MARLVGESFEDYLVSQIQVRQNLAGSGFNQSKRTPEQISVLSNRNAWLKLASSVRVETKSEIKAKYSTTYSGSELNTAVENHDTGIERLERMGIENPSRFAGSKLAEKSVLFNSLSAVTPSTYKDGKQTKDGNYSFRAGVDPNNSLWNSNYAYGLGGTKFGITPPPGLIDAKIKCMNRGSIRKAEVTLKAYNQFQFELIETLYLRLGYSMLLEWGWDKFLDRDAKGKTILRQVGTTVTEDIWFQDFKTYNFKKLLRAIERYRDKYSSNYDGFLGKVTNFDWTFNPDGSYDITLNLITIGDVIESLKVNLPQTIKTNKDIDKLLQSYSTDNYKNLGINSSPTNLTDTSLVNNAGTSTLAYDLFTDTLADKGWTTKGSPYFNLYLNLNEESSSKFNFMEQTKDQNDGKGVNIDKYGYFLTFSELIKKINKFCIPSVSGAKIIGLSNDVDNTICNVYPNQVSLDPKVCLVKPEFVDKVSLNSYSEFSANRFGIKSYWAFFKKMKPFTVTEENNSIYYGKTLNIYLNYNFISECLAKETDDNNIFLFKFLQDICNGINSAMGGVMKLEPVIQDDYSIVIQDQNEIRGIQNSSFKEQFSDISDFELFGYNTKIISGSYSTTSNFVRDFGFKTNITPDLASLISIGATAGGQSTKNYDATAFSNWNQGLRDQYAFDYADPLEIDDKKNLQQSNEQYEYDPFTVNEIEELRTHYTQSERDYRNAIGVWRPSNDKTYTKFGVSFQGKRDVSNSPISGEDYENVTWPEYVEEVADHLNKGVTVKEPDTPQFSSNYIYYLIQGFRGKVEGQEVLDGFYFHLNEDFIKTGKQAFKAYVDSINNETYKLSGTPSTSIGFIPVDLGLKCDGISGVKIYNALNIRQEFLPPQYPKALQFLITKVDHTISDNDWQTDLGTISTPKTKNEDVSVFISTTIDKVSTPDLKFEAYSGNYSTTTLTSNIDVVNPKTKSGLIYYPVNTPKKAIIIHHTAGYIGAAGDIKRWREKFSFPIATHYIIERSGFSEHVFLDEYWSNHTGVNTTLSKGTLSLELTNIGYLTKMNDGRYRDAYGNIKTAEQFGGISSPYTLNSNNQVVKADSYRNRQYFQEYTDEQLEALRVVLQGWNQKFGIPLGFNFSNFNDIFPARGKVSSNAKSLIPGIYTHNSIRTDKLDVSPTKKMLEFLKTLS